MRHPLYAGPAASIARRMSRKDNGPCPPAGPPQPSWLRGLGAGGPPEKFTPADSTRTRIRPGPGSGTGASCNSSASGPPNRSSRTVVMRGRDTGSAVPAHQAIPLRGNAEQHAVWYQRVRQSHGCSRPCRLLLNLVRQSKTMPLRHGQCRTWKKGCSCRRPAGGATSAPSPTRRGRRPGRTPRRRSLGENLSAAAVSGHQGAPRRLLRHRGAGPRQRADVGRAGAQRRTGTIEVRPLQEDAATVLATGRAPGSA